MRRGHNCICYKVNKNPICPYRAMNRHEKRARTMFPQNKTIPFIPEPDGSHQPRPRSFRSFAQPSSQPTPNSNVKALTADLRTSSPNMYAEFPEHNASLESAMTSMPSNSSDDGGPKQSNGTSRTHVSPDQHKHHHRQQKHTPGPWSETRWPNPTTNFGLSADLSTATATQHTSQPHWNSAQITAVHTPSAAGTIYTFWKTFLQPRRTYAGNASDTTRIPLTRRLSSRTSMQTCESHQAWPHRPKKDQSV